MIGGSNSFSLIRCDRAVLDTHLMGIWHDEEELRFHSARVGGDATDRCLCLRSSPPAIDLTQTKAPDLSSLPDEHGRLVRLGRDLVVRTHEYIGPEVADPLSATRAPT